MTALTPGAWPWLTCAAVLALYTLARLVGWWFHHRTPADMPARRELRTALRGPGDDDTPTGGAWQVWDGEEGL